MHEKLVLNYKQAVLDKVFEAAHTIINCWDDWEADSGNDAQVSQNPEAYFDGMHAQVECVLTGMLDEVFAELINPEDKGNGNALLP
jgi:hypothetical protein